MAENERVLSGSPELTVVLAALDDYSVIEEVHRCLEAQTIRDRLEILFVCPSRTQLDLPADFDQTHPDIGIVEGGDGILLHQAREIGVRSASAPYVLILEDHCLPAEDCLERMLQKLGEGWSAVGPAFSSGNTRSKVGIAANILTYGEWMGWSEGGSRTFVAGFNSAFPTPLLLARGERLEEDLAAPSTLQMDLSREGKRFYFEARARMTHWEASTLEGVNQILIGNGCGLGMLRARRWGVVKKALVSSLVPALILHRILRATRTWWRLGERSIPVLLYLMPLAVIWSLAELRGYWSRNRRRALAGVSRVEKNRQRFVDAALEPIHRPS